jgi:hypothetical protein
MASYGQHRSRNGELGDPYWDPRVDGVLAKWPHGREVTSLGLSRDGDGPVLLVGLVPYSDELASWAAEIFAPFRVTAFPGPRPLHF